MKVSHSRRRIILLVGIVVVLAGLTLVPSPSTSVGVYLYEIIRRCPGPRPDLQRESEFLVIGHRGAAAYAVENTLPSMDTAMARGANAVEIDLCMTADSAIVLWHDWDPDDFIAKTRRNDGEPDVLVAPVAPDDDSPFYRPVPRLTLDELWGNYGYRLQDSTEERVDAHIPTLDEFLAWTSSHPELRTVLLDIKIPEADTAITSAMIHRVESILNSHQPSFRVVYLTAVQPVFQRMEQLLPDGNLSFDMEPPSGVILQPCDYSSMRIALEHGNHHASIMVPFTSTFAPWTTARRIIQCDLELRKNRLGTLESAPLVTAATLNDESKINCLLDLGIDGIISDYPDLLKRLAESRGRQ